MTLRDELDQFFQWAENNDHEFFISDVDEIEAICEKYIHAAKLDNVILKHPVGTQFTYQTGKQSYPATVIGYHVEHDTDTGGTNVTYRIRYTFASQAMTTSVARATVDRALLEVA